jgi:hypothetical protein
MAANRKSAQRKATGRAQRPKSKIAESTGGRKTYASTAKGTQEAAASRANSGLPGGGTGRREQVGGSSVYPASGPLPRANAPYQGMASFGQGNRGADGYEDSGRSEVTNVPSGQSARRTRSNKPKDKKRRSRAK